MANRGFMLLAAIGTAVGLAACGRATDEQISQVLGITPTPTRTAEEVARATVAAESTAAAREAALASPSAGNAVALGDVISGQRQFATWCAGCHRPGGQAAALIAPGGSGASVDPVALLPFLREGGANHPSYRTTEISDKQVNDLAAYIRQQAGGQ